jgi:predicted GNAT superfamily acetyltransferase
MQPQNAYFTLGKLGARTSVYEEDFYGETTSAADRGLPTDRLLANWDLESDEVIRRLEAGPLHCDIRKELKQRPVVNHLIEVAPGMMNSSPVKLNCTAHQFLFEVPYNLPESKNRDLGIALEWQGKMRQVFKIISRKLCGNRLRVAEQDATCAFYLLEKQ